MDTAEIRNEDLSILKQPLKRLAGFAWFAVAYNLFVVLWGAFVRATGSGAGCGAHWPLCNGVVIPREAVVETLIEFTHRATSGLTLIFVVILVVQTWKVTQKGDLLRRFSGAAGFFTLTEALIGAGLVLLGLVGENETAARAVSMMAHLVNTFLLMAALILTAWGLSFGFEGSLRFSLARNWPTLLSFLMMLLLGASGAVTALGDTLYPAASLAEGFQQDISSNANFLIRLRVFHPLIAVLTGAVVVWAAWKIAGRRENSALARRLALGISGVYAAQLFIGAVNVILLAPVWIQLIHLFTALYIWLLMVLLHFLDLGQPVLADGVVNHPVHNAVGEVTQQRG